MSKTTKNKKSDTAIISVFSNSVLIVIKVLAGIYGGSVSIISEAIHSGLDLVAALIAFFAVKISFKPADKEHPFGHGKFENVSGVIESLLIFAAAIWIIIEAARKIIHGDSILDDKGLEIGIAVMMLSGVINFFVSRKLYKVAKETNSIALEADALHLKTDIYTSVGVGLGLLLIRFTGYYFLDPLIAISVALFILYEAYQLLLKAFNPLLDSSLDDESVAEILQVAESYLPENYKLYDFKTRYSGSTIFIQFQLMAPSDTTIHHAVRERNNLSNKIKEYFPNAELVVLLGEL
jgi:cation diffusion facilitator family transporter